jgi:two-component system, NtrC family, sensor kinase
MTGHFTTFKNQKDVGDAVEVFSDDLARYYPELRAALADGLKLILQISKMPAGVILVQRSGDVTPSLSVEQGINPIWKEQLEQPRSALLKLAGREMQVGKVRSVARASLGKVMVVPICYQDKQLGVVILEGVAPRSLERSFLARAGRVLGRMIHRWQNYQDVMSFSRDLDNALGKIITSLDTNFEVNETQLQVCQAILDSFGCHAVTLAFIDSEHKEMLIKKTLVSGTRNWLYQTSVDFENSLAGQVMRSCETELTNQPASHPQYHEVIDGVPDRDIGAVLCAPVRIEDQLMGVVELLKFEDNVFTEVDRQLLNTAVNSIASVLFNIHLVYQLRILGAELEASGWELTRSSNILRSLFDNMPSSVYIIDHEYRLVAVNAARSERSEREPGELIGQMCYSALFKRNKPCQGCLVNETVMHNKETHRPLRTQIDGGDLFEWDIKTYPITNNADQVVQAIVVEQDVTESRRLEAILAQSEKLAAIGQLAAGLAHEINNPLTVIMANAQLLQRELPDENEWRETAELILQAGSRTQQVIRNLLGFAHNEEYECSATDVNENIHSAVDLIHNEMVARSVSLEFERGKHLPMVMASADHLQGVWMNILLNAISAVEGLQNGVIRIATASRDDDIEVVIVDNGEGIPPDRIKRVFEPFYTTKDPGKDMNGIGLGLSVCYRIVKQHGGDIFIDSRVGEGTAVTVTIPAIDPE